MKIFILSLILLASQCNAASYAVNEDPYLRDIPVDDFTRIYLEGGFKVVLYQASTPFLRVKAPYDSYIDALDVRTGKRDLKLSIKRSQFNLNRMELHIGFSHLEEVHISGGVNLSTEGFVSVEDIKVFVEGAIKGNMKLKARTVDVVCNGGSMMELSGVTGSLSVRVTGAGHVSAKDLTAREVVFRVEGLGFGSVYATGTLDVKIEGVGKVTYRGNPEIKRIVEGLGSVASY